MTTGLAERSAVEPGRADPTTAAERVLAEVLAETTGAGSVSVESHFFDDLGLDSLVMAHFCARVRKRAHLPSVSVKDCYQHPTIKSLAASLPEDAAARVESPAPAPIEAATRPRTTPAGRRQHVVCGALQLLAFLAYASSAAFAATTGYEWISAGSGAIDAYLRSVLVGGAGFLAVCALPILAKWVLVGRWKPQRIRVWSLAYLRFWIVKTLLLRNPLVLFAGTPLYVLYLRALGAKVGRRAVILSRHVPVCSDLLTVGDDTVIRKDSFFTCYRAEGGLIQTGTVTLGRDVVVGEAAVLDIDTSMADGAQLGHASSLHAGQALPAGEHRHGSPAQQRTDVDYRTVGPAGCSTTRRVVYSASQLLRLLAVTLPLAIGGAAMLIAEVLQLTELLDSGPPALTSPTFYLDALAVSFVLLFGSMLVGLLFVAGVPRLLNRFIEPDRVYRLYGFHYGVHRAIERMTNVPFFPRILGDSSYIVPYLRWLGYDLSEVEQTGSNFGLEVKHENPYLCTVGAGTMVADGLSIINADFSSTSFRVSRTAIGPRNFLGNYIAYPPQGKTGDNCLLGTKAVVPLDGEVREDIGLLGSPSFEIPRSVQRDSRFDHLRRGDELRRRLAAKNKHNAVTIGLYLLAWWTFWFGTTVLTWIAAGLYGSVGAAAIALAGVLILVLRVVHFSLVERLATMFRDLRPLYCSIYDPNFWRHERFWKLSWQPLILDGTPFKSLIWRLLGVRIGRRVFDDGCAIVEKTLVTIGDDCTLNARSIIQAHSQESGAFKSDRIAIGAGCTLGIASLVHYGVTMGDGATLAPDSFLMKGEEVPPNTRWGMNPARELRESIGGNGRPEPDRQPLGVDPAGGFTPIPRWTLEPVAGVAEHRAAVPDDVAGALRRLADEMAVPLSTVLLTAHARVLASLTGVGEVATGYVAAAGDPPLPCRFETEAASWRALLRGAGRVESELLSRRGLAVGLDEVGLPEASFETVLDPTGGTVHRMDGAVLRVGLSERHGELSLQLAYRTDALDANCAARIAGYHVTALRLIAADPDTEPAHSLLSEEELRFQLEGLAGPRRELPERRFHELFEQRAAAHPEALAAVLGDRRWTYGELNARANRLGRALLARGLRREGVVAVVTERNLDWMAAVLAVFKAGGVYLPIEPQLPADRIAAMLSRAGCELVLTEPGITTTLDRALESLPGVPTLPIGAAFEEDHDDGDLGVEVAPDQLAYIYFTSGSTGEPKGAMCEQAGMLNHLYAKVDDLELGEGQVVAQTAPQSFDISLWQLVSALLVGGRTLIVEQEVILDIEAFVERIAVGRVNVLQVVPSYLEVVVSYLEHYSCQLPDLRCVSVTGEPVTKELLLRWFALAPNVKVVNAYGLTETSDDTNHEVMVGAPDSDRVPLGRPVSNVRVYVVDEGLSPAPLGAPGEIVFSGVCVGRGYVNDPERTRLAFLKDPHREGQRLYRSGDYGRWRPDGKLEFLGRRDAQVKIRGFRIEIGEVESALLRVPGVRAAAVVAERSAGGKRLVAFYTGRPLEVEALRAASGESLPAYMVPSAFHRREALPLTANGKVDRKVLTAFAAELEAG